MRKFKAKYTEAFLEEQVKWFEERMDRLPQSLQINDAAYSPDLRRTVKDLIVTLQSNKPSIVFAGYLNILLQIKDKLKNDLGNPSSKKYVFRGLDLFATPPRIIDGENYQDFRQTTIGTSDIVINVFNIKQNKRCVFYQFINFNCIFRIKANSGSIKCRMNI